MKETVRMLAAALIAAGLFLALFLLLHWNLIVCILLSVGAYVGLYLLLKPSRKIAGVYLDSLPDGEEIRKMLEEAADDIKTLKESSRKIADPAVRKEAEALFATGSPDPPLPHEKTRKSSRRPAAFSPTIWRWPSSSQTGTLNCRQPASTPEKSPASSGRPPRRCRC